MRVAMLIEGLRTWGSAALLIFPAHRRLRRVEAENAELRPLRSENAELRRFAAVAVASAQTVLQKSACARNKL